MTEVSLDPGRVLALADRIGRHARTARSTADGIDRALRSCGLFSRASHTLDHEATIWETTARTLVRRSMLAAGFVIDLRHGPAPTPESALAERTPVELDRLLEILAVLGPTSTADADGLVQSIRGAWRGELLRYLRGLDPRRLCTTVRSLTDAELTLILTWLGPSDPGVLQRVVDAMPQERTAPGGASALATLRDHLHIVELAAGRPVTGSLSFADLEAAVAGETIDLPPWLRRLAVSLVEQPVWFTNVARGGWTGRLTAVDEARGTLTPESLDLAINDMRATALLADRSVFDRLDGARDAERDGLVSRADLEHAIDRRWFDEPTLDVLRTFISGTLTLPATPQSATATQPALGPDPRGLTGFERVEIERPHVGDGFGSQDGRMSYDDLIAAVVNLHSLTDHPAAARRFVEQLPATFDDLSGHTAGLSLRAHSDDGVRSLASAALSDAPTLADQVNVVARLPESRHGERNLLITLYYSEIGERMNERLNHDLLDPTDPTLTGHTGANWMLFAPFASEAVRAPLSNRRSVYKVTPSWHDRQSLADGNQQIFGDIAPRFVAFLDAFPPGQEVTEASLRQFFLETPDPTDPSRPLFRPGHNQLRDALLYYAGVLQHDDPLTRQRLTSLANTLIATHEQASAQRAIDDVVHQRFGQDQWWKAAGSTLLPGLGASDEVVATEEMRIDIGTGPDAPRYEVRRDVPPPAAVANHLLVGRDLTVDLNPSRYDRITIRDGLVVHQRGDDRYDLALPDLGGWDDPPPDTGMERFPTDTAQWFERGTDGSWYQPQSATRFEEPRGTTDGLDTRGTRALDWSEPEDRQWHILNLFNHLHVDEVVWLAQRDFGVHRDIDGRRVHAHLPAGVRRTFER